MGEGESLYGGLDRSTVYTAQSVLQLQKLLQRKQHMDVFFLGKSRTKGTPVYALRQTKLTFI